MFSSLLCLFMSCGPTEPPAPTGPYPLRVQNESATCAQRVCYYTNWAQYRPGKGKFVPEDVDPDLCTHLIYSFATLTDGKLAASKTNDEDSSDGTVGMYTRFNRLKNKNPQLKTLLAVGGPDVGSASFARLVATVESRRRFIHHAVSFLRSRGFDGLSLDWEYPGRFGSPAGDKHRFTSLCREFRTAFQNEAAQSGKRPLLLTAAVASKKHIIDKAYEVAEIAEQLDFLNLKTFDYNGEWNELIGHNAPLYAWGKRQTSNVDFTVRYYIERGAPPEKLNLGLATYGRTFIGVKDDHDWFGLFSQARGGGPAGKYTQKEGFNSHYEICQKVAHGAKFRRDRRSRAHYALKGNEFIGYDDIDTFTEKMEYALNKGLGGVMIWSIDLDDFKGEFCGEGRYPLINFVKTKCRCPQYEDINRIHESRLTPAHRCPPTTPKTKTEVERNLASFVTCTPDAPLRGSSLVDNRELQVGETVKYTCQTGWKLGSGDLTRACTNSGVMDRSPPVCVSDAGCYVDGKKWPVNPHKLVTYRKGDHIFYCRCIGDDIKTCRSIAISQNNNRHREVGY